MSNLEMKIIMSENSSEKVPEKTPERKGKSSEMTIGGIICMGFYLTLILFVVNVIVFLMVSGIQCLAHNSCDGKSHLADTANGTQPQSDPLHNLTGIIVDYDGPFRAVIRIAPNISAPQFIFENADANVVVNMHHHMEGLVMKIRFTPMDPGYHVALTSNANITKVENSTSFNVVYSDKMYYYGQHPEYAASTRKTFEKTVVTINVQNLSAVINRSPKDVLISSPIVVGKLSIIAAGSGDVHVPNLVFAERVDVNITGQGSVKLTGDCRMLTTRLGSTGSLDAGTMLAQTADVDLRGSGNAVVSVANKLYVNMYGSGSVFYRDSPQVELVNSGKGQLVHYSMSL